MHYFRVFRIGRCIGAEQPLRLGVGFNQRNVFGRTAGQSQVVERTIVDWEDRAGRPELRRHVSDRRAIGDRQRREPFAEELDELADDALLAQHLRDLEHEIGRGHAFAQFAFEPESDDFRNQHRHRLPEHCCLGFNAANSPGEHTDPIDHRGVRIRTDRCVGICARVLRIERNAGAAGAKNHAREIFNVDLVHDAGIGRDRPEAVESRLPPLQKRVTLAIALEFEIGILLKCIVRTVVVDLHGVIDHELDRLQRIDCFGIAPHRCHRIAHCGQIDDARYAGKILQQHACRAERNFLVRCFARIPTRERLDIGARDRTPIFKTQQILKQNLQTIWQPRELREPSLFDRVETEICVRAISDVQRAGCVEAVCVLIHGNRRIFGSRCV